MVLDKAIPVPGVERVRGVWAGMIGHFIRNLHEVCGHTVPQGTNSSAIRRRGLDRLYLIFVYLLEGLP